MKYFVTVTILTLALFDSAWGHGYLIDPVSRSSRWRKDDSALKNYEDNELFCGGLVTQHSINGGKCGLCGDDYSSATPRPNELGGKYGGTGVIVRTYEGNTTDVKFIIENNHLGYVYFELCNLDEFEQESEDCFAKYRLQYTDGSDNIYVGKKEGLFNGTLVLPNDVKCEHCVIRWTYVAANNWNPCTISKEALGCGTQETFKNCADIRIV